MKIASGSEPTRRRVPAVEALGALGVLAGDEHRLAERGRLFLDAAGVGDHEVAAGQEAGEGRVAERLGEEDVVAAAEHLGQRLADPRVRVDREDEVDRRVRLGELADAARRSPSGRRPSSRGGGR